LKKSRSKARARLTIQVIGSILLWSLAILSVPLVLIMFFSLHRDTCWAVAASWGTAMTVVAIGYERAKRLRALDLKTKVSLYVKLLAPEKSKYGDAFQLEYENRGSVDLQARINLYVYPLTRGRNDRWSPTFNEPYRNEIRSLGPYETHDLVLSPNEIQTFPYSNLTVLPACGLHGYVPHWLTVEVSSWPEGRPELSKTQTVIFYILWFCGDEHRFPGRWMIDRNRIRCHRHNSRSNIGRWRQQMESIVPANYQSSGLHSYIESKCSTTDE